MMDDLNYTRTGFRTHGKERSTVANYVRLLKLPPISRWHYGITRFHGHARALINVDTVISNYIFQ
jgi:ParB family chromosome partitioning protein